MKKFTRHVIGPDERLILSARLHWIYLVEGALWFAGAAALGMGFDRILWRYIFPFWVGSGAGNGHPIISLLFGGVGLTIFIFYLLKFLMTDIVLTSQRLIYKKGLIFVEVKEIDLIEIHAEYVHHGLLGRFLGYGKIKFDSRFIGDIRMPAVSHPYKLLKSMHSARSKLHDPLEGYVPQAQASRHS